MSRDASASNRFEIDDAATTRRRYLGALGATAATVGLAGCLGAAEPGSTETPTPSDDGAIDPQYGFIGRSADAEPPVEPDHEVQLLIAEREGAPIPEFYFEPSGLLVEAGDVVKFNLATPDHTITAYHPALGRTQRVPDGVPALSSPVLGINTYWLCRFETPGVYDLYCAPHEPYGMAMRLVVDEASGPGGEPVSMEPPAHGEPRAPAGTSATVLNDPALDADAIVEQESVTWADIADESKQLQG